MARKGGRNGHSLLKMLLLSVTKALSFCAHLPLFCQSRRMMSGLYHENLSCIFP